MNTALRGILVLVLAASALAAPSARAPAADAVITSSIGMKLARIPADTEPRVHRTQRQANTLGDLRIPEYVPPSR